MIWTLANILLEHDLLPDQVVRAGIRRLLAQRLRGERHDSASRQESLAEQLRQSPIAISTADANNQHYEVPTRFFELVLGRHLKYSSAYWPAGVETLDDAEAAMLALTAERADLADGQEILELGCGWGSLTFYTAERFPSSRIVAVCNSRTQRGHIESEAHRRGLDNIEVITADINNLDPERFAGHFDRVVSVEMFEHMRNYPALMTRIATWMQPDGRLFVHIFCHRELSYPFETRDASDWMARYFFTGGMMPSADLLIDIQDILDCEERWMVDGTHYEKTALAWLANMDHRRDEILPILYEVYGPETRCWWVYWRVFFLACAELFGYRQGNEWQVAHYRFTRV